jgi:Zn-dependent protease with chaperone function
MSEVPYPSLADFASTWRERREEARPDWVHPVAAPLAVLDDAGLRAEVEALLDTIVAVQRAEWVQDGIYLGPRSMPDAYRDLLDVSRTLGVPVPPAVVTPASMRGQNVFGTDGRAFLHLSSFYLQGAKPEERRFVIGRLCGHIAATHVTWLTCYALLVDQGGLRQIARKALGPALEIFLAPISFGAKLALSHWHRAAELTADRAGYLCAGDRDAVRKAMLRMALGVRSDITPDDYLAQLKHLQEDGSPARWAEMLSAQPWMHKRMEALDDFVAWKDGKIDRDELDRRTAMRLTVGGA